MTFDFEKLAELAAALPTEVSANAQALVESMSTALEGIGDEEVSWRPGHLKVVQATSDRGKLPKGAGIGSLVLGDTIVEQPLKVIPLRSWEERRMWNPDQTKAEVLCWSADGKTSSSGVDCRTCPHAVFDEVAKRSACSKSKKFLVLNSDLSSVFDIDFSKTNFSYGREWEKMMKTANVLPYRKEYSLQTETGAKAKNVEALKPSPVGSTAPELLEFAAALFTKCGEDRREYLRLYLENSKTRANKALLAAPPQEGEGEFIDLQPESSAAPEDDSAPKYSL